MLYRTFFALSHVWIIFPPTGNRHPATGNTDNTSTSIVHLTVSTVCYFSYCTSCRASRFTRHRRERVTRLGSPVNISIWVINNNYFVHSIRHTFNNSRSGPAQKVRRTTDREPFCGGIPAPHPTPHDSRIESRHSRVIVGKTLTARSLWWSSIFTNSFWNR